MMSPSGQGHEENQSRDTENCDASAVQYKNDGPTHPGDFKQKHKRKVRRLGSANLVGQSLRQTTVTPHSGLGVVLQDLVNVERLFRFSLDAYSCPPALTRSRNT